MHDNHIKRAAILSAALHVVLVVYVLWGRWFFRDTTPAEPFITVELVDIASVTQARQRPLTQVSPEPPEPELVPETKPEELIPEPPLEPPVEAPVESPPEQPPAPPEPVLEDDVEETEIPQDQAVSEPELTIPDEVKEEKPEEKPLALPKAKPKYKPSKKKDQALTSILKNLLPKKSATKENKSQEEETKPSRRQGHTSSRLSDRDTVRLQDAIRQQLIPCWNPPAGAKDARDLVVTVDVSISKEGMITRSEIVRDPRLSDTFYRAAAESARRATRNPRCQPLKLPPEHYEDWKDVTLTFDPKNL